MALTDFVKSCAVVDPALLVDEASNHILLGINDASALRLFLGSRQNCAPWANVYGLIGLGLAVR